MSRHHLSRLNRRVVTLALTVGLFVFVALPETMFAQAPWERAAANLEASFTGPLARSLALVAIVIGGLMFMFGEGGAKRQISGIVFGGGLALFAAQFLTWLF
jgi:type IV secretory pathway VirB2 component (pilin)